MLELKNISVTAGKGSGLETPIIKNLSLKILPGEFVVIIGGNGAGKSTLFNAISGNISLEHGSIFLDGQCINSWEASRRSSLIAQVFQDPKIATLDAMTIEENLSFAFFRGKFRGFTPHKTQKRLEIFRKRLSLLGMRLEDRLEDITANLSGGQRQALSLIMATLKSSKILLLDEITAALDPKMGDRVMQLTHNIVKDSQQTTLMITHNMNHALEYGDRTLLLQKGKILQEFSREQKRSLTPLDLAAIFHEN